MCRTDKMNCKPSSQCFLEYSCAPLFSCLLRRAPKKRDAHWIQIWQLWWSNSLGYDTHQYCFGITECSARKEGNPTGHWHPQLKDSSRQDLRWCLKKKRCYLPGLTWYWCAPWMQRRHLRSPQALLNKNEGIAVSFLCVELPLLLPNDGSRKGCVH